MFKHLRTLYWKWRLGNIRNQLETRLRKECDVVEIEVGNITLTSFNPDKKQTGEVNGEEFEFYHSIWDGKAYFPFWGGKLQISISAGAPRPEQHQLDAVQSILTYPTCIRAEIESALFDYYKSNVYHEGAEDLDGKPLPKPTDHNRIRKILYDPTIELDSFRKVGDPVSFKLNFECDWDEDHGVSVCLENWIITDVGI